MTVLKLLIQHFWSYQNLSAFDNYVIFSILSILTEVYTQEECFEKCNNANLLKFAAQAKIYVYD